MKKAILILTAISITAKLVGLIDWSWWWVTAPFWGPIAIFTLYMIWVFVKAFYHIRPNMR